MNFKSLVDEAISRGEKIKSEVMGEIFKSKAIRELVSNQNFITAVSRIIETKDEVKRAINQQVKSIFEIMDVPTKDEVKKIGLQLNKIEKVIDTIGRKNIAVRALSKPSSAAKKTKSTSKSRSHKS